jgi:hypothetical protein
MIRCKGRSRRPLTIISFLNPINYRRGRKRIGQVRKGEKLRRIIAELFE